MSKLSNFFRVIGYIEIGSTNDEAIRLIKNREINAQTIILSERQTSGRGKEKAVWESPIGNIYISFIFLIDDIKRYSSFQSISLLIGQALYEVINLYKKYEIEIKIKKPNDVLINGKKIAGILPEFIQENNENYLIIGIGINWLTAPLETSDHIDKFLKIEKDEFIFHLSMNVMEKISNFHLYENSVL